MTLAGWWEDRVTFMDGAILQKTPTASPEWPVSPEHPLYEQSAHVIAGAFPKGRDLWPGAVLLGRIKTPINHGFPSAGGWGGSDG